MKTNSKNQARKSVARPVIAAPRQSAAAPGHPLTRAKPEERAHPAERKAKHKHTPDDGEDSEAEDATA